MVTEEAVTAIAQIAEKGNLDALIAVCDLFAHSPDGALLSLLTPDEVTATLRAVVKIAQKGDQQAIVALRRHAADPDDDVRRNIEQALREIQDSKSSSPFVVEG